MSIAVQANRADIVSDGRVDWADFSRLSAHWNASLPWCGKKMPGRMIAHWRLDQNAQDSQSAYDGLVIGNPAWVSGMQARIGSGALQTNGQDYIEIDPTDFPALGGSFTLTAWFRTNYKQQTQTILSKGNSAWQIGLSAGTGYPFFTCSGLSGTSSLTEPNALADGQWHQLAGVFDADQQAIRLYLDQSLIAEAYASGQVAQNALPIWIGGNPETGNFWWRGTLDDIRMYDYALTAEQIFRQNTFHVDAKSGSNNKSGMSRPEAFKSIQHAIDAARNGDTVLVWPGVYTESIFLDGKAITIKSAGDPAILRADPADGIAVTMMNGEQADTILENLIIFDSVAALYIHQTRPTLRHLTVVNNEYGAWCWGNALPTIGNSIFWNNSVADISHDPYFVPEVTYCCVEHPFAGMGNISEDPLFANPTDSDPNRLDFHLLSEYGRYKPGQNAGQRPRPENWVLDARTSPCIDAADPTVNPGQETMPNGGRVNIGAYGNTPFAGKSHWPFEADFDYNGQVGLEDFLLMTENWLVTE